MKILVVNDDNRIRELFQMWLEREGFDVHAAVNGKEVVKMQLLNKDS